MKPIQAARAEFLFPQNGTTRCSIFIKPSEHRVDAAVTARRKPP
jgi:hypothetical protein